MLQELIYTSAPVGLKPGSQGFCTVACTTGTPQNVVKLLETLSGYRHVFLPPDPNVRLNPQACSHLLLSLGGVPWHILSRTIDAGLDYLQQKNSISHHLVLDNAELQDAGPAAILSQYSFLASWNQKPVILPANKKLPAFSSESRICEQWVKLTGDAGWGGILAETALTKRPVSIIFRPGMNMLQLMDEALALLPPEVRWQVSFSTYYCNLPNGTGCQWKCILSGSPEMSQVKSVPNTLVIDLTQTLAPPPAGRLVEAARTGKLPEKQEISIIPLAIQGGDQAVYGTQTVETPSHVAASTGVTTNQTSQTPAKPKPAKDKTKSSDDVASKGCFWMIILFFIFVTAGLIGGIFWYFSKDVTQQGSASVQKKIISDLESQLDTLTRESQAEKVKMEQLAAKNAEWEDEKKLIVKSLSDKDGYINRVAEYFSLFPQVNLPPISVNIKDDIPRKDGEQNDLLAFNGTLVRQLWDKDIKDMFPQDKDMLSVDVSPSYNEAVVCQLAGTPRTYPSGNVLLGYPFRLYAQKEDDSYEPIAEFDLIVTESGISVRAWNDDMWNKLVEEELKQIYQNQDGFGISDTFRDWYETNVKDKPFELNEVMLKRMDELAMGVLTGDNTNAARLIELRKSYYEGDISLQFIINIKLSALTQKVKDENR